MASLQIESEIIQSVNDDQEHTRITSNHHSSRSKYCSKMQPTIHEQLGKIRLGNLQLQKSFFESHH